MSLRVLFVILALCAIGLHAGWDMTQAFLGGKILVNPCVLFLPISIGLALGYQPARSAADGLFKFLYLFIGLILAVVAWYPGASIPPVIPGLDGRSLIVVVGLTFIAVLALLHWLLYTPPFDEWFKRGAREPGDRPDRETRARTRALPPG